MNEYDKEQKFLHTVSTALDESLDHIDAHAQSRLRQARSKAMQSIEKKSWLQPTAWLSAGSIAAICIVAITGILYLNASSTGLPVNGFADVDLIASDESLELFENLEFYQWLQQEETGAG